MNNVLMTGLVLFLILSVLVSYAYYSASVLNAELGYSYQGVCQQYTYNYSTGYEHEQLNPIYNATQCDSLELNANAARAFENSLIILIVVDVIFMFLYWLFVIREAYIRQGKK